MFLYDMYVFVIFNWQKYISSIIITYLLCQLFYNAILFLIKLRESYTKFYSKFFKMNYIPFTTTILNMPNTDWLRSQRRHYIYIHNRSQILGNKQPEKVVKFSQLDSIPERSERRHYCVSRNASTLDEYF